MRQAQHKHKLRNSWAKAQARCGIAYIALDSQEGFDETRDVQRDALARSCLTSRDELAGDVVFMFQPGEEGYEGAQHMIDEGLLDAAGSPLLAAYGYTYFPRCSHTGSSPPDRGQSWLLSTC
jgi:hypothetical protein